MILKVVKVVLLNTLESRGGRTVTTLRKIAVFLQGDSPLLALRKHIRLGGAQVAKNSGQPLASSQLETEALHFDKYKGSESC